MKKTLSIFLVVVLSCLLGAACGKKAPSPQAGSAQGEDMLSLFPKDTRGVLVVDVHRIMMTESAAKAIKDNEKNEKYVQFVQETGIDPQKDIFFFAGALMGDLSQKSAEGAAVINLKYDQARLLESMKKARGEFTTADYNGLTIYQFSGGENDKPVSGIFLDASNILAGSDAAVKKMADVYQKRADSVLKNEDMTALIKGMNTSAMVWGGIAVPPETVQQATSQNPMLGAFSTIHSLLLSVDFKDETLITEIKAMSPDAAKNKDMADTLTGFKALGAGAASKEPLVGQLLDKIEIVSAPDSVKIVARIPNELIQSLSEKAKSKEAKPATETGEQEN